MKNSKNKLSCKNALSIIIICALSVILMQLNVFAVDTLQITTDGMAEEITVVKVTATTVDGNLSASCEVVVAASSNYDINNDGVINMEDIMLAAKGFNTVKGNSKRN